MATHVRTPFIDGCSATPVAQAIDGAQSMLEPANHFVYGLGIQAWEFRDGARSLRGTRIFRQIRGRKRLARARP